ncbi:hypothetical protein GRAQ_01938 [Rahnella aquatilis CIP 78.65 = ATCC 33071]|nr:hypothetical protein GRAQ_01938 [Rahnella aquatilis CIP 78.65 = ATCC 33071]
MALNLEVLLSDISNDGTESDDQKQEKTLHQTALKILIADIFT